jgi:hypothetical protein
MQPKSPASSSTKEKIAGRVNPPHKSDWRAKGDLL